MTVDIDISVEAAGWAAVPDLDPLVRRAVAAAVAEAGLTDDAELSLLLCDDAAIRVLNRTWRAKDVPTNVLSFPAPGPHPGGPRLLGDIAVAWDTVAREAAAEGKSVPAHLSHLVVHGVLHLLDHDHEEEEEAEAMEAMERRILDRLGIADPYAVREPIDEPIRIAAP